MLLHRSEPVCSIPDRTSAARSQALQTRPTSSGEALTPLGGQPYNTSLFVYSVTAQLTNNPMAHSSVDCTEVEWGGTKMGRRRHYVANHAAL